MPALYATIREVGPITIVDLSGRIALGEGSALLRRTIRELAESGKTQIVLNLGDINYIDSSGIGELVSGFTALAHPFPCSAGILPALLFSVPSVLLPL